MAIPSRRQEYPPPDGGGFERVQFHFHRHLDSDQSSDQHSGSNRVMECFHCDSSFDGDLFHSPLHIRSAGGYLLWYFMWNHVLFHHCIRPDILQKVCS